MSTGVDPGFTGYELLFPSCFSPGTRAADATWSATRGSCGPSGHTPECCTRNARGDHDPQTRTYVTTGDSEPKRDDHAGDTTGLHDDDTPHS